MTAINIHEITDAQNQIYKAFFMKGLIEDSDCFRITVNDELTAPFPTKGLSDSFTLGAYIENNLAGIVSFEREGANREKLRHKGLLFRMYISREYRGLGIAKILINDLLKRVKALDGIEQINLTVIATNYLAKHLYEKYGFVTYGLEKNAMKWRENYFTEEQMVLFL